MQSAKPVFEPSFIPKVVGETEALPKYPLSPKPDLTYDHDFGTHHLDVNGKIEPNDEAEAQRIVRDAFRAASGGRDYTAITTGYNITVKLYVRPEELKKVKRDDGTEVTLYLPDTVRADDAYNTAVGLVIDVGDDAYEGETITGKKRFRKPWCHVGSWVLFKRTDPVRVNYKGVALSIMTDDNVVMVIDDPKDISIGQLEFRA